MSSNPSGYTRSQFKEHLKDVLPERHSYKERCLTCCEPFPWHKVGCTDED